MESRSRRWSSSCAGDRPIPWIGVFLYCKMARAALSLSREPWVSVFPLTILIPKPLRKKILHCLHSAHQGVDGMKARANDSVYWPGMNASIWNFRANCSFCTTQLTSHQLNILSQSHHHFQYKWKNFLCILFNIDIIHYLECSVLEKSYCISAYVAAGRFPYFHVWKHIYIYIYIYSYLQTDCFVVSQLFSVAWPARHLELGLNLCRLDILL